MNKVKDSEISFPDGVSKSLLTNVPLNPEYVTTLSFSHTHTVSYTYNTAIHSGLSQFCGTMRQGEPRGKCTNSSQTNNKHNGFLATAAPSFQHKNYKYGVRTLCYFSKTPTSIFLIFPLDLLCISGNIF